MKQLLVIFLIVVFALHHVGYYFIYVSLRQQNEASFKAKLEKDNFKKERLRNASIPITLPYQPSQENFQTVGKKLYIKGNYYRVIKMKYARDTLHLIYIDDISTKELKSTLEKWISRLTENSSSDPHDGSIVKLIKNQYFIFRNEFKLLKRNVLNIAFNTFYFNNYKQIYLGVPNPPPKCLSWFILL